jgi:hypothetical protein
VTLVAPNYYAGASSALGSRTRRRVPRGRRFTDSAASYRRWLTTVGWLAPNLPSATTVAAVVDALDDAGIDYYVADGNQYAIAV